MLKHITDKIALLALVVVATGCQSTVTVQLDHDAIPAPATPRDGIVGVGEFVDTRSATNKAAIGENGPTFVLPGEKPVADEMEDVLERVLRKVGYEVVPAGSAPVVLEGELFKFWGSGSWNHVVRVGIHTRLKNREGGNTVWEQTMEASEDDAFIILDAYTATMNLLIKQAVESFSSQEFYDAVKANQPSSSEPTQ